MTDQDIFNLFEDFTRLFAGGETGTLAKHANYPAPVYLGRDAVVLRDAKDAEMALGLFRDCLTQAGVRELRLDAVKLEHTTPDQCLAHADWLHFGEDGNARGKTSLQYVLSRESDETADWRFDVAECHALNFPEMPRKINEALGVAGPAL